MTDLLRSLESFFVFSDGIPRQVHKGELVKPNDPAVKGREHLFASESEPVVEQATAAPGEKRAVTRKK